MFQAQEERCRVKKLVTVLATSASMAVASKEATLERISSIWYSVQFQKDRDNTQALLDLGSEDNAMNPAYAKKLGLRARQTDVGA